MLVTIPSFHLIPSIVYLSGLTLQAFPHHFWALKVNPDRFSNGVLLSLDRDPFNDITQGDIVQKPFDVGCFRYTLCRASKLSWRLKNEHGENSCKQVWSLTQFYSVEFLQSRIGVNKCVFYKRTTKVCVNCWRCPGTSAPSTAHLTVSLYLCSSGSNAPGESRAWEGCLVSSKSPSRVRDGDEGVAGRKRRE